MSVPATLARRTQEEKQLLQDEDILRRLFLDVVQKGVTGIPIEDSVVSGEVLRSMEEPSTVTITVHDQRRFILNSKKLQTAEKKLRSVDITIDDLTFRLVKLRKQGDDLVFTFEQREIVWLKDKHGPRKAASRAKMTRAQYILQLIHSARKSPPRIKVRIHELDVKQPIAKLSESEREDRKSKKKVRSERDREREPGFSKDKVAGLDVHQTEKVETCLIVADRHRVEERAKLAMLTAMAGESNFGKNLDSGSNAPSVKPTTFQSMQIPESQLDRQAYHFLFGGRSFRAGGAVQAIKDHGEDSAEPWTIGAVVDAVEISDRGHAGGVSPYYDAFVPLARRILKAWGEGGGGPGSKAASFRKRFEFKVEKDETYYDAIIRMATEVNWRAFMAGDTFRYISEEDLFKSRPRYRFSEASDGILNIDFDQDYHKEAMTGTVECRIHRWAMVPGTTVYIDDLGSASGKWLVLSVRRNLYSSDATVSITKPMREKMEPRQDLTERRQKDSDDSDPGSPDDAVKGTIRGDLDGMNEDLRAFLEIMAGMTKEDIFITAGLDTGHAPDSLHHDGRAADIDVGGDARQSQAAWKKGENIAIAALRVCGEPYRKARLLTGTDRTNFNSNSEWNGYSVEIGWRTLTGGNHFNHVHVGFERDASLPKPVSKKRSGS